MKARYFLAAALCVVLLLMIDCTTAAQRGSRPKKNLRDSGSGGFAQPTSTQYIRSTSIVAFSEQVIKVLLSNSIVFCQCLKGVPPFSFQLHITVLAQLAVPRVDFLPLQIKQKRE